MPLKHDSSAATLPPRPMKMRLFNHGKGKGANCSTSQDEPRLSTSKCSDGTTSLKGSTSRAEGSTSRSRETNTYCRYSEIIDPMILENGIRKSHMTGHSGKPSGGDRGSCSSAARRHAWQKSLSEGHLELIRPICASGVSNWVFGNDETNLGGCDRKKMEASQVKAKPGFFRSISLKNLLKIGGMSKSRSGCPIESKKVLPPIAPPLLPGLVSFSSFRVKKGQTTPGSNPEPSIAQDIQQQRYSTCSSESDSPAPYEVDPYIIPPHSNHSLKDLEDIYGDCDEGYVDSRKGLKTSASFDSFTTHNSTQPQMHQNHYKIGGPPLSNGKINGQGHLHGNKQMVHNGGQESTHYGLGQSSNHPQQQILYQQPHPIPNQPLTSHYQTQISLEDQGIDMTQSPGRESPSSTASSTGGSGSGSGVGSVSSGSGGSANGCRHSTSSFDSGRASGSTIYQQGVRYSGLSSESSSSSFRHSYHSSNSSLGSIPPPEDICNFDVSAMIAQGIPDHEVLNAWLTGVHFECYYQNFLSAGYDIHTISRMTPEDLNAIGVTKPHHRKRLKAEISQLTISDGLMDYIPNSIDEWLGFLRLDEYTNKLKAQGYHDVRQVTNITWEDLDDIGILKLGHQKKFMLAIKRVEDILAGKRVHQPQPPQPVVAQGPSQIYNPQQQESYSTRPVPLPYSHPLHHQQQQQQMLLNAGGGPHAQYQYTSRPSTTIVPSTAHSQMLRQQPIYGQVLTHHPQIHQEEEHREYHPEVISIHLKNGARRRSMENVTNEEPIYGTSSFLPPHTQQNWQRCSAKGTYEMQDGDRTPTNEMQGFHGASMTSTLPRLLKNKPIAKIMGGGDRSSMAPPPASSDYPCAASTPGSDGFKSLPRDIGRKGGVINGGGGISYMSGGYGGGGVYDTYTNVLQLNSKNPPPPTPRRGSAPGESIYGPLSTFQQQGGGYMGWTTHFPPPPPTLSCDLPYGSSPGKALDDLPLPPHPEELQMSQIQSGSLLTSGQSHPITTNGSSTPSSSSSSPNNPVKMVTTTSVVHYHPHMRTSPQNVKSRNPSPDFSDSDLPNNGLISRGVRRNGSDASFKSNSSTESESIPFANDNAGTIKQQKASNRATAQLVAQAAAASSGPSSSTGSVTGGTGDVLNDIGNMLADLTDELDAILEQEIKSKR